VAERSGWRFRLYYLYKRSQRFIRPITRPFSLAFDYALAGLAKFMAYALKRADADASSNFMGWWAQAIGPWLPASRTGRANLRAAYPEKSKEEIEEILKGVWENLGRVAGEFVHLDKMWDYDDRRPNAGRIETFNVDRFIGLYTDEKPAILFSAHLGNWELAAVGARHYGLDSAVLFRMPNNRFIADFIQETRADLMSQLVPAGSEAALFMAGVIERGGHLGMLVDQHRKPGVRVNFFGRPCWANATLARLARHYDCPVHGARVIRLPKNRFRIELTRALDLPRDAEGKIEIAGTMQMITSTIEGWVREHPEQWLWLHRRWRD
jgi:Kdo2-lipid IVA lauroyltransferase/acyltransferase